MPASSSARTTVVANPSPLATGARRRRPSWLTWTAPATYGCERDDSSRVRRVQGHLEPRPSDFRLQLRAVPPAITRP